MLNQSTVSNPLTSAFGSTTTTPFGGFGSGLSTASCASSTGFNFGLGTTSTAPSTGGFGFGLGTATTTSAGTGFSFGSSLGTTSTAPSGTFSFGLGTTTTAPSTGFSFGGIGTTPASSAPFSFGTGFGTTTSAPTFGGLTANVSSAPTGFTFGQQSGGLFGQGTSVQQSSATPFGAAGLAGVSNVNNIAAALSLPIVFGDERDAILAKWNQLQAFWGTGKGYFSTNSPPVDFTPENPFCRFKAVGYSCLPMAKPEDGYVGLTFNKKETDFRNQQKHVVDSLHRIFGSKPTICVCVEGIKALPEDKTEMVFYLLERAATGVSRHVSSAELCSFFEQSTVKSQLISLEVLSVSPKTAPTKEQLQAYLDNPPAGIDPLLWQQAKLDNPDPNRLIPVPMIGFNELHRRLKCQEHETKQHQERLDIIAEDIAELNRRHTATVAKIAEHKRKQLELEHRVLKIMVQQEIARKMGFAVQPDEEQLRTKLEAIQDELSAPTQFKGHLKELISQIRMQNHQPSNYEVGRYSMDEAAGEEIKAHLHMQQEGIAHLINILKADLMDLKTIQHGVKEALDRRR